MLRTLTKLPSLARAALALALGGVVPAQVNPARGQGVDPGAEVIEQLGAKVALDAQLVDENGKPVKLGAFFDGKHPVVLNLGYYGCPALCGAVLNGLVDGLKGLSLNPGDDFEIVTVSIDPNEKPELASEKKQAYLKEYGRAGAESHWHFLTGTELEVRKIADAIGFGYRLDTTTKQYMHGAAVTFVAPDGMVARYLFGIDYPPKNLRMAIVEAGRGNVGTVVDKILLNCYRYDPKTRGYTLAAMQVMQWAGAITVLLVGGMIFLHFRRERRDRRAQAAPALP